VVEHVYDMMEILVMSLALGMDAFSLAIGVGLQGLNRDKAAVLVATIGLFHVLMTITGIYAGLMIQGMIGQVAAWMGALLLLGMGLHMAYTTLFQREDPVTLGGSAAALTLFAAGVSVDALSVGFSLGLRSTAYGLVSALAFGLVAALMCGIGLVIGKRANRLAGMYGQLIGALILIGYGAYFALG
jgi:putative Mn2+ efflux pump MntP